MHFNLNPIHFKTRRDFKRMGGIRGDFTIGDYQHPVKERSGSTFYKKLVKLKGYEIEFLRPRGRNCSQAQSPDPCLVVRVSVIPSARQAQRGNKHLAGIARAHRTRLMAIHFAKDMFTRYIKVMHDFSSVHHMILDEAFYAYHI